MANPEYLAQAFAKNGAKATIPNTTTTAGRASLSQGFPAETSLPLAQGGVPPRREDFNGILYTLSSYAMFQQAGGKFTYDARVDYTPPAIIFYGSDLWWCVQANGASSLVVTPGTNTSYWIKLKDYLANPLAAYPVGAYYISSDSTSPAVLFGGTWTQIQIDLSMRLALGTLSIPQAAVLLKRWLQITSPHTPIAVAVLALIPTQGVL